jgi:hypothetical protein
MKPKNGKAIGSIKSKTKRNHEIVNTKNKTRKWYSYFGKIRSL